MNVEKNVLNDGVFSGKHGFNKTIQLIIVISNILGAGSISEYGFDWYLLPSNIEELIPIINKSIAMEAAWTENIMNGKAQSTVNDEFDVQA